MSGVSFVLTISIAAALLALGLLIIFLRQESKLSAESEAHWQQVADAILEQNPEADVTWCFRSNRPPFRNPTGPPERGS